MLQRLQIENYALIERATLDFGGGFNILTGETGSGKSIVVDALGLLLGDRADPSAVRSGAERAVVTGVFSLEDEAGSLSRLRQLMEDCGLSPDGVMADHELIVRREVATNGRGRAFLNNQPATVTVLRQVAPFLGEIHSQHESLTSFTPAAQLRLLDRFGGAAPQVRSMAETYGEWREHSARLAQLMGDEQRRLQDADLWRFQAEELDAAQVQPGEDAVLEQERLRLANAERILADALAAYSCLYDSPEAAAATMKTASRHLQDLARFEAAAAELWPRLESLRSEVEDIAEQVRSWTEESDASPERMALVEERILLLDRLKRKYGPTLDDVLQYHEELARKLDTVERSEFYLNEAAQATEAAAAAYRKLAEQLTEVRQEAAERLSRAVEKEVADLAMKLKFMVQIETNQDETAWTATGWDRIGFFASTNPGEPMKPLAEIASGGELSRVLLALQVVIEQAVNPKRRTAAAPGRTLVFDEIDAGIGGRAAETVGRKMQQLASRYQLLCVTHLAQIATCGQHHLRVDKAEQGGRTMTQVSVLKGADRVEEIARMLAGDSVNETSLQHARELLEARAGKG